jgi:hypothetical protein
MSYSPKILLELISKVQIRVYSYANCIKNFRKYEYFLSDFTQTGTISRIWKLHHNTYGHEHPIGALREKNFNGLDTKSIWYFFVIEYFTDALHVYCFSRYKPYKVLSLHSLNWRCTLQHFLHWECCPLRKYWMIFGIFFDLCVES